MATQLEINKQAEDRLKTLQDCTMTQHYTEQGMLHFNGSGGPFNYAKAVKYLSTRGVVHDRIYGVYDDTLPNNEIKVNRIKILKKIRFDVLLNQLRADALNDLSSSDIHESSAEYKTLEKLFADLTTAASVFISDETNNLDQAKDVFRRSCIQAIGESHHTLISNRWERRLLKILGVVMSIGTLGISNYATGRSMYGLLSSRIDTTVKLNELLKTAGYLAQEKDTPLVEATLVLPSAPYK